MQLNQFWASALWQNSRLYSFSILQSKTGETFAMRCPSPAHRITLSKIET